MPCPWRTCTEPAGVLFRGQLDDQKLNADTHGAHWSMSASSGTACESAEIWSWIAREPFSSSVSGGGTYFGGGGAAAGSASGAGAGLIAHIDCDGPAGVLKKSRDEELAYMKFGHSARRRRARAGA